MVRVLGTCTLANNLSLSGRQVYNHGSSIVIRNSILHGLGGGELNDTLPTIHRSLVGSGYSGPGADNLQGDPLFLDASSGHYVLRIPSPCIDAGDNSYASGVNVDLAGQPRRMDVPSVPDQGAGTAPIVDMGAYEQGKVRQWR